MINAATTIAQLTPEARAELDALIFNFAMERRGACPRICVCLTEGEANEAALWLQVKHGADIPTDAILSYWNETLKEPMAAEGDRRWKEVLELEKRADAPAQQYYNEMTELLDQLKNELETAPDWKKHYLAETIERYSENLQIFVDQELL